MERVDRKLEFCSSRDLLNIIAREKFGDKSDERLKEMSINYRDFLQEKFSSSELLNDFDFTTKMGITVESQVSQEDYYYDYDENGGNCNLKIRKTEGVDGDYFVVIYKNIDNSNGLSIVAFDITHQMFNKIRDKYKCIKCIQKTRTVFKSNLGIEITCDSDIISLSNSSEFFRVSNARLENIDEINYLKEKYDGEIWEISCGNKKLYEEFDIIRKKMLAYVGKDGKELINSIGAKSYSDLFQKSIPKVGLLTVDGRT